MAECCAQGCGNDKPPADPRYRRILLIALVLNAGMFGIELAGGWRTGSVSLLADALDFFGDAANYGVSLFVLALAPLWRPRVALAKGVTMGVYGFGVLGTALWHLVRGTVPDPQAMGWIGVAALATNAAVGAMLYAYRHGDADMRSVWLCTRNDMLGNLAVLLGALGVFGTGAGWPDILVAVVMGALGLSAARTVITHARRELRAAGSAPPVSPAISELKRR
jgi:Co/Zn/Cd efflux system component